MADIDKKNTTESFDKEFSLNQKNTKSRAGKIPSWIMILAGAAVIAGVVIAKQPAVHTGVSGTRASVSQQSGIVMPENNTVIGGDSQAAPSELEAHFGTQDYNGIAASFVVSSDDQVYNVQLDELPVDDAGQPVFGENTESDSSVYWVDEKPFAVSLEPTDEQGEEDTSSVYWIDDKSYSVNLVEVGKKEFAKLSAEERSNIISVGDSYYRLLMEETGSSVDGSEPNEQKAVSVPDKDPFESNSGTAEISDAENDTLVWMDGKAYQVTVIPYDEIVQKNIDSSLKTALFSLNGKAYEICISDAGSNTAADAGTPNPVIWLGETPLRVSLQADSGGSYNVQLEAVPDNDIPALYESHFGAPYDSGEKTVDTEPETDTNDTNGSTEEPKQENWFVGLFHDIFGGSPTATPTPQVTVIPVTPTTAPLLPTATPIIVRMAPTSTPNSPLRLEDSGNTGIPETVTTADTSKPESKAADPKDVIYVNGGDLAGQSGTQSQTDEASTGASTSTRNEVSVTLIGNTPDASTASGSPSPVPTQEELPQTGMAESWNIPSMLAMLVGLLLVIIGVRRLRTNR